MKLLVKLCIGLTAGVLWIAMPAAVAAFSGAPLPEKHAEGISPRALYVNDVWTPSDVFTTGSGSDSGNGSVASPYSSIGVAQIYANDGDTIFVDGGYYSATFIFLNKQVKVFGTNWNINPNTASWGLNPARNAESVLVSNGIASGLVFVGNNNIEIRGFKFEHLGTTGLSFILNNNSAPPMFNVVVANNIFVNNSGATNISLNQVNPNLLFNFSIIGNRFEQAVGTAMLGGGIYGLHITGNYFANITSPVALNLQNIRNDLTITGNRFHNITRTGLLISNMPSGLSTADVSDNHFSNCNTSGEPDRGAINIGQHWNPAIAADFESILNIRRNIIVNGSNGVVIAGHATQIGNIRLNQNSLLPGTGPAVRNYSPGAAGILDASCNWYGQLCDVDSRIVNVQTDGRIEINPRLMNGTDTNSAIGFQPAANACPSNPQLVNAGNYSPVCRSQAQIPLTGQPGGGTWSGIGLSGTSGSPAFNPSVGTQTLTYYATDSYGCNDSDTVTITVYEDPAIPVLLGSMVCSGTSAGGQVSISGSESGISYQLFNSSNQALQSPKPGTGGLLLWDDLPAAAGYYVRVTNANGCSSQSNSAQVQVFSAFLPGAIMGTGQQICSFENPAEIGNAINATGGDGSIAYKWQSSLTGDFSDGLDLANSNTINYDPPTAPGQTTFYRRLAKDGTCAPFTPSSGVWAIQLNNGEPISSGRILNRNSGNLFCTAQMAIDHSTTLDGHIIELGGGAYAENITAGSKALTFLLSENPDCIGIQGDLTLSSSTTLAMKIHGASSCLDYDRITISGTLRIHGATLHIPLSAFSAPAATEILLIEVLGTSPVEGQFSNSIVGNGLINYQVRYDGGDGNDIVLTRYLGGTLDMGIFTFTGAGVEGHKLQVKLRPAQQITQGVYTAGVFAIRSPAAHNVVFHYLAAPAAPIQYIQVGDKQTHQGYDYFFFQYEGLQTVNWSAGYEYPILTLGYDCTVGNAAFELVNDLFTASQNGDYYQELGGSEAQGIYYASSVTGPPALTLDVSSNSPLCESMILHLSLMIQGGTPAYTQTWAGPATFQSNLATESFQAEISHEGYFRAIATDENGCEVRDSVYVEVIPAGNCVSNYQTGQFYPSITAAVDAAQTLDGHTLLVPASEFLERVIVNKALLIEGVHSNTPCGNSERITPESRIVASGGAAFTIAAEGVTIRGLQIEGDTGIINNGFDHFAAINNHITVEAGGVVASGVTTSANQSLVIEGNCVELRAQLGPGMTPSAGIVCSEISGTHAVVIQHNHIEGAFYGYHIIGLDTDARTMLRGGRILDVMQGVAIFNTIDNQQHLATSMDIEDLQFLGFMGQHPDLGDKNFHAGIHIFTEGNDNDAVVDLSVRRVEVSAVGSHTASNAGMSFVDITTGSEAVLFATLDSCAILDNANMGIHLKGSKAILQVFRSEFSGNGYDPFSGNGYGILAEEGAQAVLRQNYFSNPVNQLTQTAIAIGLGATYATVEVTHNHFNRNGNGFIISNPHPGQSLSAACNWWGSARLIEADQFTEGRIDFIPYLDNPQDADINLAGFQPTASSCIFPTSWYVNDFSTTQDVFSAGPGNDDFQGTPRRPFRSVSRAIQAASSADTIFIDAGRYDEQLVISETQNRLYLVGPGTCIPSAAAVLDFSGVAQGKPAVLDIAADSVTIEGIRFEVDLSLLNSAIIASSPTLDTITLSKLCIEPYESNPGVHYGPGEDRVAISINYGGHTDYRTATGGMKGVFIDRITVAAEVSEGEIHEGQGAIGFQYALAMDEGSGVITRNMLQAFTRDVWIRNPQHGTLRIGGSPALSNHFLGGGLLIEDIRTFSDSILISSNLLNGIGTPATMAMMTLRDNIANVPVRLMDNTFQEVRRGLSLENFRNVEVDGNIFFPRGGFQDFRLMTVNTKSLRTAVPALAQVPIGAIIRGNTFHTLFPATGGVALACYNHNSQAAAFGSLILGTPLRANHFSEGFEYAILLGDHIGSSLSDAALAEFPEYNLGPESETPMACWDRGIDIRNNTFETGSGTQQPASMGASGLAVLESILYHDLDFSCLGLLRYFDPLEVESRMLLQGAYDPDSGRMRDLLRSLPSFPVATPYTGINAEYPGLFELVNNTSFEEIAPGVLSTGGNNAIVDWVWLELRDKTNPNQVVATRSALLQADGDVVDMDGISPVVFAESNPDSYYVFVGHRNHLAVITAEPVDLLSNPILDFSDPMLSTMGTSPVSARKLLAFGLYGLVAGNAMPLSSTGREVKYHGEDNDRLAILNAVGNDTPLNMLQGVYRLEDVNMDGVVKYNGSGNDRLVILNNVGIFTPLNIIVQEPGN